MTLFAIYKSHHLPLKDREWSSVSINGFQIEAFNNRKSQRNDVFSVDGGRGLHVRMVFALIQDQVRGELRRMQLHTTSPNRIFADEVLIVIL